MQRRSAIGLLPTLPPFQSLDPISIGAALSRRVASRFTLHTFTLFTAPSLCAIVAIIHYILLTQRGFSECISWRLVLGPDLLRPFPLGLPLLASHLWHSPHRSGPNLQRPPGNPTAGKVSAQTAVRDSRSLLHNGLPSGTAQPRVSVRQYPSLLEGECGKLPTPRHHEAHTKYLLQSHNPQSSNSSLPSISREGGCIRRQSVLQSLLSEPSWWPAPRHIPILPPGPSHQFQCDRSTRTASPR